MPEERENRQSGTNAATGIIKARIYQMQSPSLHSFPEQQLENGRAVKTNLGLAMSGGGSRAMSLTSGYLRGINAKFRDVKVDYLSSVSGGSWASSVYSFYTDKENKGEEEVDKILLGEETNPEDLSFNFCDNVFGRRNIPGKIAMHATPSSMFCSNFSFGMICVDCCSGAFFTKGWQMWTRRVREQVLTPLGLRNKRVALDEEHLEDIKARNKEVFKRDEFVTLRKNKPFLIINAIHLGRENINSGLGDPFQITPLYSGVPYYREKRPMTYKSREVCGKTCITRCCGSYGEDCFAPSREYTATVGGGLIETFALNSGVPDDENENKGVFFSLKDEQTVETRNFKPYKYENGFYLHHGVAASSAALAYAFKNLACWVDASPRFFYTPYLSEEMDQIPNRGQSEECRLGDAGSFDNLGILSLLQRKVKNIACFIHTSGSLNWTILSDEDISKLSEEDINDLIKPKYRYSYGTFSASGAVATTDLLALFGYIDLSESGMNYSSNQVFRRSEIIPVLNDLKRTQTEGYGAVCKRTLEVLPNSTWNIEGDDEVNVLFVYNAPVSHFEERLKTSPDNCCVKNFRQYVCIDAIKEGPFAKYPQLSTNCQNCCIPVTLSTKQVTLLAAQGEYIIKNNATVEAFFNEAKKTENEDIV
eukprot:snap_masked-scaffold_6-processed-gene-7.33-mRNA-1 protein AED:1.00 eAED:1.00 QI:0/-1/0/0/-1/1/1/0/647